MKVKQALEQRSHCVWLAHVASNLLLPDKTLRIYMGEHNVEQELDERKLHEFMQALLADLRALAFMLEHGCIESGVRRIGAEQEMFHRRSEPAASAPRYGSSGACRR